MLRTQLTPSIPVIGGGASRPETRGDMAMCTNADYGLTMAGLLGDPLIQMVMRSDGVSHEDHAALWQRVRDTLAARLGPEGLEGLG